MNEQWKRHHLRGWSALALAGVGLLGCGAQQDDLVPTEIESTQAAIKAALGGVQTDVELMRFELFECPSATNPDADGDGVPDGAPLQEVISPMGPGFLPDGLSTFQNKPADAASAHPFSDGLFVVRANVCHVVRSTPLKQDKMLSKDCYAATKQIGAIPAGKTKEVVIINQCKGNPKAVADTVALLNHPPELIHLSFDAKGKPATKFTEDCPDELLRVCAKVLEPDNDPLEWYLFDVDANGSVVSPQVTKKTVAPGYPKSVGDGLTINCWDVKAPGPGSYNLWVVARDMMWDNVTDPANPKLVSVEQILATTQHEWRPSRASQQFPIHVLPCQDCAKNGVDVVFAMDTSGSMTDDGQALCDNIAQVQADLMAEGIVARATLYGITEHGMGFFSCLTNNVVAALGASVPGTPGACGPVLDDLESWGPATAIIADRFNWKPGAVRVVVPISDEEACRGEPCEDPGQDHDSIVNAVARAVDNKVIVSPIVGEAPTACVTKQAGDLAAGTGGISLQSTNAKVDVAGHIKTLLKKACGK